MSISEDRMLVTSAARLLDSRSCERFLDIDHDVLCFISFIIRSEHNIQHFKDNRNFEFQRHDLMHPFDAMHLLNVEVDETFNLACSALPNHFQCEPTLSTKAIVTGAINMLGLRKRACAKISAMHAPPISMPTRRSIHRRIEYETHINAIDVRSCYFERKQRAKTVFSTIGGNPICLSRSYASSTHVDLARVLHCAVPPRGRHRQLWGWPADLFALA